MTRKLAPKLAPSVVPKHGNGLLLPGGQPGHRGGGGRPSSAYREWVTDVFESDACKAQVRKILENADHPAFSSLFGKLAVHVLGLPKREESDPEGKRIYILSDL